MKKKILMLLIIILSICLIPVKAQNTNIKSIYYGVVVTDSNGVDINGKYKDENGEEKTVSLNIPQNTKIKVLREYMKDGILYGYIKYTTSITVKSEDTTRNSTNVKPDENIQPNTNNDQGIYNDSRNTTNLPSNDSYGTASINRTSGSNERRYVETKKTIEVEGDIDLSKCKVESEYSLNDAIDLKETKKIMIVNNDGIDMYNGPALIYGKITSIPAKTELEYNIGTLKMLENNNDLAWVYINYNNQKGWIYKGFLNSGVAEYKKGRLLSFSKVSIKEFPNKESKTLETLPIGLRKSFTYIYGVMDLNNDEWYYIDYKGTKGWVKSVAIGVNTEISLTKNVKLYNQPSLDSISDNIIIPSGTKLKSIYKYSKENDAFYVEYNGNTGWIILEFDGNNKANFEVNYLEDNIKDKMVDVDDPQIKEKERKSGIKLYQVILILLGIIVIIVIIILLAKKKRKQGNDFTVHEGDIIKNDKPKVTLINRSRMGR